MGPALEQSRTPVTSAEIDGVLELVNSATLSQLDDEVRLDSRAAQNIVEHRVSDVIDSLAELDAISYVGPSALSKLLAYADENGYIDSAPAADSCFIISEYIEAWGNYNKAVELFNCGDEALELSDYSLCLVRNDDTTCTQSVVLAGGTLAPGAVHSVCRRSYGHPASSDPAFPIKDRCDQEAAAVISFSGDDRLLLLENQSQDIADAFGVLTFRPASSTWSNVLYRRCDFSPFDGFAFDLSKFTTHSGGDMGDFGKAPVASCPGASN